MTDTREPIAWMVIDKDGTYWEANHTIHPVKQNGEWFRQFPIYLPEQEHEAIANLVEQMGIEGYGTLAIAAAIRARGQGLSD